MQSIPLTFLPHVKGTTNKIGCVLKKCGIQTMFKPYRMIEQLLSSVFPKKNMQGGSQTVQISQKSQQP